MTRKYNHWSGLEVAKLKQWVEEGRSYDYMAQRLNRPRLLVKDKCNRMKLARGRIYPKPEVLEEKYKRLRERWRRELPAVLDGRIS